MDLFSIVGTIWRNKIAAIPVVLIIFVGLAYVLVVKPPTYSASASILLADPPGSPTKAQLAADPALAKISSANPFLSYGNLAEVADIVIEQVSSPASQQSIAQAGASPEYKVSLSTAFGTPPIIEVTDSAANPSAAIQGTATVASSISQSLNQIQAKQGVNPYYMIKTEEFVRPTSASKSVSSKLRTGIGFLALGLVLLLIAVSFSEAMRNRRRDVVRPAAGTESGAAVASASLRRALPEEPRRYLSGAETHPEHGDRAHPDRGGYRNSSTY